MKIILFFILALMFLSACSHYGTKLEFNKGQLYYTENVTADEARKLGDFLVREGFFDGSPKTVQLDKRNDTFLFRMVVKKEKQHDSSSRSLLKMFSLQISQDVYGGSPVAAHICNDRLKTIIEIPYEGYGKRIRIKNGDLFYTVNVSEQTAQKLAAFLLKNEFYGEEEKSVLIDKNDSSYQFKIVVKPEYQNNPAYAILAKAFGTLLSKEVFDNQPVEVHFCDSYLRTIKILRQE